MKPGDPLTEVTAGAARLVEIEALVRRALYSPRRQPADVDDLVQLTLERVIAAWPRLEADVIAPYALVVARNLVISQARRDAVRRKRYVPSSAPLEPPGPEESALASEQRRALQDALSQLAPSERQELVSYQLTGAAGLGPGPAPGAVRTRMARLRAKARLEYVLAFRRVELPTVNCRRTLLAISAGNQRQQREVGAAAHLSTCETCQSLLAPLEARNSALVALGLPVALARWLVAKVKPRHGAVAAAALAVAAATLAVVAATRSAHVHPTRHQAAPNPPAVTSTRAVSRAGGGMEVPGVLVGGRPLVTAALARDVGQRAIARMAVVEQDVTHNGFWLGTNKADRVWAQFVGPLRPLHVQAGDRVSFTGTVVAGKPPGSGGSFPAGARPNRSGEPRDIYLDVDTQGFAVQPGP